MFDDSMTDIKYLSEDYIHPNETGHKRIALNILKQL
jgi:lysophospholipase L1-like esterase